MGLPHRIIVIGTSGSGKTTLAREIARRMDGLHIEMDALNWEADWQMADVSVFRERLLKAVTKSPSWTLDGNYSKGRDIGWRHANTIIWLDYKLHILLYRIVKRSLRRGIFREKLWNGNIEPFSQNFTKDGMIYWVLHSYKRRRVETPKLLADPDYAHLTVLHFKSPKETQTWLDKTFPNP